MPSYAEIQAEIARLTAQAEALRKDERARAIVEIKGKMDEYQLTLADITGKRAHPSKGTPAPIKYRHPVTGQTWTGRGKHPRWLAEEIAAGKDVTVFAIA